MKTTTWQRGQCTGCGREAAVRVISEEEHLCEYCEPPAWVPSVPAGDGYAPDGNTGAAAC